MSSYSKNSYSNGHDSRSNGTSKTSYAPTSNGNSYRAEDRYVPGVDEDDKPEDTVASTSSDKIDFEKYEEIPVETSGRDCPSPISTWRELKELPEKMQQNIEFAKYLKPTPVQKYSLPIVMKGRDLMSCAQTGSGKTAAFLLPMLASILKNPQRGHLPDYKMIAPLGLVLAPTRELACQIHEEAKKFSRGTEIRLGIVYGGVSLSSQMYTISRGVDVLVATPGRLVDILERKRLTLSQIRFLVLDEADRMLDMGFEPQIRKIVEQQDMPGPGKRQTLMFSATFAKEIQMLAASFLYDYIFLTIGRVGSTTELVTQKFVQVATEQEKESKVLEILSASPKGLTLIFVERKKKASWLDWYLRGRRFSVSSIHGDKDQHERTAALKAFSTGLTPILIATNVAARGLDISNVSHVINYDMPSNIDDYVHRIGRTGRAGKSGISTAFISPENIGIVSDLVGILKDANQEVPSWLSAMVPVRGGYRGNSYRGGRGGGGGQRFGGRDFRGQQGGRPQQSYGQQNYGQRQPYGGGQQQSYGHQQQQQQPYQFNAPPSYSQSSAPAPASSSSWNQSSSYSQQSAPQQWNSTNSYSSSSSYNSSSSDSRKRRPDDDSSEDKRRRTDDGHRHSSKDRGVSSSSYRPSYSSGY